jgi:hypothetical protein
VVRAEGWPAHGCSQQSPGSSGQMHAQLECHTGSPECSAGVGHAGLTPLAYSTLEVGKALGSSAHTFLLDICKAPHPLGLRESKYPSAWSAPIPRGLLHPADIQPHQRCFSFYGVVPTCCPGSSYFQPLPWAGNQASGSHVPCSYPGDSVEQTGYFVNSRHHFIMQKHKFTSLHEKEGKCGPEVSLLGRLVFSLQRGQWRAGRLTSSVPCSCNEAKHKINWVWWLLPVILARKEVEAEESFFETSLGYKVSSRPVWTT